MSRNLSSWPISMPKLAANSFMLRASTSGRAFSIASAALSFWDGSSIST